MDPKFGGDVMACRHLTSLVKGTDKEGMTQEGCQCSGVFILLTEANAIWFNIWEKGANVLGNNGKLVEIVVAMK